MILSAQSIRERKGMILPFCRRTHREYFGVSPHGAVSLSYGLSSAGYDIRVDDNLFMLPHSFYLASSLERFEMPDDLLARVADKSTLARLGLAVQNTVIEPGWCGYLTLELTNHSDRAIQLCHGMPIAQIIFEQIDHPTDEPYDGKYQNQERGPQEAR